MAGRIVLDYDAFYRYLADELHLDASSVPHDARMRDELGYDSLLMFELVILIEELVGGEFPEELISQLITLDDVYAVYSTRVTQA